MAETKGKYFLLKSCGLFFELIPAQEIRDKKNPTNAEKKLLRYELSGREDVEYIFLLRCDNTSVKLSANQIKDFFENIGFDVDVLFSKPFFSDRAAVMNVGGYIVPFLGRFMEYLLKTIFPTRGDLLVRRFIWRERRIHIRFYHNNGDWYMTAHLDVFNVLNWTEGLWRFCYSHIRTGQGDYAFGTQAMIKLLRSTVGPKRQKNEILDATFVEEIINLKDYEDGNNLGA